MILDRRLIAQFDWTLFALIWCIPFVSLVVLYSAGYRPDSSYLTLSWIGWDIRSAAFAKQALYFMVGLLVMIVAVCIPPSTLFRYAYVLYGACVVLLIAVLLFGTVVNGSRRWLSFGTFNLQPAEPMKMCLILAMARFLSRNPPKQQGYGFLDLIAPITLTGVPMALIMRQPDLGTALSIGGIGAMMTLFMGVRVRSLAITAVLVIASIFPAWHMLHGYQQRRILTLFNPESDPLGSGYHIIQSKIAVGSGAFLGKGYLKGTQSQLEFLPEHTTDFIFSVLAEEWGFIGSVTVLLLYFLLLSKILLVVLRTKDLFSLLVTFGVGSIFFFHTVINIGMVVGLMPVVGIPMPLVSYGGSSVLSTMFGLGLILGINMRRLIFLGRS